MPNTAMAPVMGAKNQDAQNFQQALQNYQMQMQQNGVQRQGLGEALQYQQGLDNQARQNAIAQMNYDQTQFTQRSKDGGALLAQVQKDILSQSDNGVYTPTAQANMRAKVDAIVKAYPELGHPDDVWQMTYQPDLDAEAKGAKVLNATTAASKETRLQNNDTFNQAKTGFINNVVVTNKTGTVGTDDIARYNNWATQEATDNPSWWAQNKASFPPPKLGDNWQTYLGKTKYNTQVDEYNSGAMDSQAKAAIENWQKLDTKYQNDYKEAHTDYEKEDANTKKIGENLAKAQADLAGNKPGASQAAVDQWQNQLNFAMKVRDLAWQRVQDAQNVRTQHIANMPKYTGKQTIQNRMNTSAPGGGNGGSGLTGSIGTDGSSVDVALPDGAPDPVPVAMQPARDAALAAIRPMITDDSGNPVVMNPMAVSEINALYPQNLNPQDRAKQVIAVLSKYHDDNLESDELPGLQAKLAGQAAPTGITNQQSQADRAKTITGQNTPKATAKPGVTKNGLKYRTPK